jgi:hypothetical protein
MARLDRSIVIKPAQLFYSASLILIDDYIINVVNPNAKIYIYIKKIISLKIEKNDKLIR